MRNALKIAFGGVLIVVTVVAVMLTISWTQVASTASSDELRGVTSTTHAAGDEVQVVVTKAQYQQLTSGMTYEQVAAIIGHPGEEQMSSETNGFVTKSYAWSNPSAAAFMTVVFQNNELVSKSQVNLH